MHKSLWIALLVVIVLYLARVPPGSEPPTSVAKVPTAAPAPVATAELPEPVRLSVLTSLGTETIVTIDEDTEVLVVATWCPYTRQLNSALKDWRFRQYLRGKRLVYLFAYDELDKILRGLVDEERSVEELVNVGHDAALVARIEGMVYAAEYKRRQAPPGVRISRRYFGRERRYPITNRFREGER